jgi:hypothetical protein
MALKDIHGQSISAHFAAIIDLVSERLSRLPGVLSIMVGGSVARGWADEYSDLDVDVICKSIPPEPDRSKAYQGFGPPICLNQQVVEDTSCDDEFDVHLQTGRTMVVVVFTTHKAASQWVEHAINMAGASEDNWHDASYLQDGLIILDTVGILNCLRDRIHPMPDPIRRFLVAKAVERMSDGYTMECAKKGALRGDVFSSHHHLLQLIKVTAHVCLAFNGKYYPGDKNLQGYLSRCAVLPKRFVQRLVEIISNPDFLYAFQQWCCLAQEVVELIADTISDSQRKIVLSELAWISDSDWHP